MQPCVYATSGWGIHDRRWVQALRDVGFDPVIVRLGIDADTPVDLRKLVESCSSSTVPVLAGPLNSVAHHLTGLAAPVAGLSWGFDLHEMDNTIWLTELSGLIVDSQATARIAESAGVPDTKITTLPWGVDLSVFSPTGPIDDFSRWGIPQGATTILSLRAHEHLYRVADIIEGFAEIVGLITDAHLIIGHSGSLTGELQQRARALRIDDRTHFIGSVPEDDLPALLRGASAYVSASEVDGTSVTLLQAMACKTPVVVSSTPGNAGWVQESVTGHVFQTGDAHDLARALLLTLSDNDNLELVERSYTLVSTEADWSRNVQRLRRALLQAVQ